VKPQSIEHLQSVESRNESKHSITVFFVILVERSAKQQDCFVRSTTTLIITIMIMIIIIYVKIQYVYV